MAASASKRPHSPGSFTPSYARTSYNEAHRILYADFAVQNSGQWNSDGGASGQNTWFNIVRFVGVVVTDNSNGLYVQPAGVTDPNLILTNLQPAGKPGNSTQFKTAFAAPKLSY